MGSTVLLLLFWLVVMGIVAFWITQFNDLIALSVAPQTRSFRSGIGAVGFQLAAKVVNEDLHS
jgi:hypothetical protein